MDFERLSGRNTNNETIGRRKTTLFNVEVKFMKTYGKLEIKIKAPFSTLKE